MREAVYGHPPAVLAAAGPGAVQLSPLEPGATGVEAMADASLDRIVALAPPGALERRFLLAHALRALAPGGELIALAPKSRGGARLAAELQAFGCQVQESARRHHRICRTALPAAPLGLAEAIAAGAPRRLEESGLWTQPGVFSWDRLDPGSAALMEQLDGLAGAGADLGCGIGVLALAALRDPAVRRLVCIDIDRRAVEAARRNITDPRAVVRQANVRRLDPGGADHDVAGLDFVIMNPPFHHAGEEDRGLGPAFISKAASMLRRGGVCRLVANIALPYEAHLNDAFGSVRLLARQGGYKVYEARR